MVNATVMEARQILASTYLRSMGCSFIPAALLIVALSGASQAAPRRISLDPPASEVAFRAYGMGLVPIDATFTRFDGWLIYDPEQKRSCSVALHVQVASLITGDTALRATIVGPDFMDADSFPTLTYVGACEADGLGGTLEMHGVSRPFALDLSWRGDSVTAEGRLLRADWGMKAMPLLGGRTVRIRVSVPLAGSDEHASHHVSAPRPRVPASRSFAYK